MDTSGGPDDQPQVELSGGGEAVHVAAGVIIHTYIHTYIQI